MNYLGNRAGLCVSEADIRRKALLQKQTLGVPVRPGVKGDTAADCYNMWQHLPAALSFILETPHPEIRQVCLASSLYSPHVTATQTLEPADGPDSAA